MPAASVIVVASIAFLSAQTSCFLNFFLLYSIFFKKKSPIKPDWSLIYFRFGADSVYTLFIALNMLYFLLLQISSVFNFKNFIFYLLWPSLTLGTIRATVVFLITLDRVIAAYIPVFYHNYRSRIPIIIVFTTIICYIVFEQYVLFGFCGYVLDVPLSCDNLKCAISQCYYDYWLWYEQIMYVLIGILTISLCFRLFVWNYCNGVSTSHVVTRATRIALLESVMICTFDAFPSFLLAHIPSVNFQNVGPISAASKNTGFAIEAIIICRLLIFKKESVQPMWSTSRISPSS